jgi:ferric-dicitrate binding protein FerR (iron transport regulator)
MGTHVSRTELGYFMDCKEAENLFVPHITGELESGSQQTYKFQAHLAICQVCSEQYESCKRIAEFIESHKTEFAVALDSIQNKANQQKELKHSWQCIEAKLERFEAQESNEKIGKTYRFLVRISAAAACIAFGIYGWLMLLDSVTAEKPVRLQVASAPAPTIKIQLLSDDGGVLIPAGQTITSHNSLKTLIINDKHRLIMNANTILSISQSNQNKPIGCMINMVSGQIYAHVTHDFSQFIVSTAHGRAVITGTTFGLTATNAGTTLVVVEGSVKFESKRGSVQVTKGQISKIVPCSAPTSPVSCKTVEMTAWATAYELEPVLAKIQSISGGYDLLDHGLGALSGPIELERINYEDWIEEKQVWFKREFPHIFQVQKALGAVGIEVGYPELLTSSGDIWQFVYPEKSPRQIPIPRFDSLLKAASKYGFDEQWLTAKIPVTKYMIDIPIPKGVYTGPKAFKHWASCFEKMQKLQTPPDSKTLLGSLHAAMYLFNTRTLAWLSLINGRTSLSAEDKAKIYILLQNDVNKANELAGRLIRMFAGPVNMPCEACRNQLNDIIENINSLANIEKGILEYEDCE